MISERVSKFTVKLGDDGQAVNNQLLYHAESSYSFLKAVYNKEIPFFSDAYSILVNTFERMYKGIAAELQDMHQDIDFGLRDAGNSHYFTGYAQKVNKFIPIASNKEAYYVTLDNLSRIAKGYTNAKYGDIYEYTDFEKDFRRFDMQRKRLYQGLNNELIKFQAKDVMAIDENEDIDHNDIDLLEY